MRRSFGGDPAFLGDAPTPPPPAQPAAAFAALRAAGALAKPRAALAGTARDRAGRARRPSCSDLRRRPRSLPEDTLAVLDALDAAAPRRPSSSSASRCEAAPDCSPRSSPAATRSASTASGTFATTGSGRRSRSRTSRPATRRSPRRCSDAALLPPALRKAHAGRRRGLPPPRPRGRLLVNLGLGLGAAAGERIARRVNRDLDDGCHRPAARSARYAVRPSAARDRRAQSRRSRGAPPSRPRSGHPRRRLRRAVAATERSAMRARRRRSGKVLIVASPGGHLLQMLALEPAWATVSGSG